MKQKQINDALIVAAREGWNSEIIVLIEAGAEIDAKDVNQWTPLHWAAWNGRTEACLKLLNAGATMDARSSDQWTPLHQSAWNGHTETCCTLLEAGVEINAMDEKQWTPLHRAACGGRIETCLALIAFGACSHGLDQRTDFSDEIKAMTGITARQAAVQGGLDGRLLELLNNHPSDRGDDQVPGLITLAEKHQKDNTALILRSHAAQIEANKTLREIGLCGP